MEMPPAVSTVTKGGDKKKLHKPDSARLVVYWGLRRCIPCEPPDVGRAPCSSVPVHGGLRKTPGLS
jgi:hypothetical protein